MQTPFLCSYIIPYHHTSRNLKMLRNVISTLSRDIRIQIIIVETGNTPRINQLDLKCEYTFAKSDTWNLGWLYNIGYRKSKTDLLFFGDFSFLPRLDVIHSIINNYGDRHCIYCQTSINRLTKEMTDIGDVNSTSNTENIMYEGITFYTRDGFIAISGYDENVFGRDLFILQDKRNRSLLSIGQVDGVSSVKLFVDEIEIKDSLIEYSSKHLNKILELDIDKTRNYIRVQGRKNGYIEKYHKSEIMNP